MLSCLGLYLLLIGLHDKLPSSAEACTVIINQLLSPHFYFFIAKPKENKPSSEIKLEIPELEREISDFAHFHIIITSYFNFDLYLVMPKNSSLDPGCAHFGTEQEPAGWSTGSQRTLVSKLHLDLILHKLVSPIALQEPRTLLLFYQAGKTNMEQLL